MKLAKLSLAAIVAVGAMTTFASAASLEEAIKGVELNGYLRYRFQSNDNASPAGPDHTDEHRVTGVTDFTIPVADNLKAGMMLTFDKTDRVERDDKASDRDDDITLNLERLWFQYAVDGFSLKAGKIEIFSPWTDPGYRGSVGDGALALYTGVPGWTLGAAAFTTTNVGAPGQGLYALGALGSVGPVDLQLWGASMTNVAEHSVFAQVGFEMAGFNARIQANQLKLDKKVRPTNRDGFYWGVEAGYEMAGFSVGAGYTKNDKDQGTYNLAADDSSGFIFSGAKQINGTIAEESDMQTMFIDFGYGIGAYSVGAGYTHGDVDAYDLDEFYVEAAYAYSKNFKLSTYFSSYELESKTKDKSINKENDRIRFQAVYKF